MLSSRQDLADYTLRTLGAPILNIEVADEQLDDAIESALIMFKEYHSDGIDRDYLKHKMTFTVLTFDTVVDINTALPIIIGENSANIRAMNGTDVTISKIRGPGKFAVGDVFGTSTITAITFGDVDNGWIPVSEDIMGIIRVLPWATSFADGLFDVTYQLRMNDLKNLYSGDMNYFTGAMEYLSLLDFLLKKEKQFRFNRRQNRLYLDIDWFNDVKDGTYFVVECYRALDDATFTEVFNDPWLKKYASALVKKYWGTNLRKYNGVQLPGGVTLDGERIYAEAVEEIHELERDLIENQSPLSFMLG